NPEEAPPKEPAAEVPVAEPADPNKTMTPEEIEAMLAAMNAGEEASKEPAAEEPVDPNKTMTPEEIEAMLAAMNPEEAPEKEPAAEVPIAEPADPNKTMTPEEIEAMLAAMNPEEAEKEPAVEVPAAAPADPNKTMTPEEIEIMTAGMNGAEETTAEKPEAENSAKEAALPEQTQANVSGKAPADSVQDEQQTQADTKPSIFAVLKEKFAGIIKRKGKADGPAAEGENAKAEQSAAVTDDNKLLQGISLKLGKKVVSKRNLVAAVLILLSLAGGAGFYFIGGLPQISFISKGSSVNASVQSKLAKQGIAFTADEFVKYAGRGNKAVVELFLLGNMEADVYRASDGVTPLMAASSFGRVDIIDLLIDQGANVNAKDKDDQTALMKAVKYNQAEAVEHLLSAKADVRGRDLHGNTVVSFALDKKDPQIMTMLSKAGARGLEEGLAQIRAAVKTKSTKGKNGENAEEQLPSISPEFLIKGGRAGYAQIGRPVETLYANYPEGNIISGTGYADGRSYPLIKIMVPGQSSPSLLLSLNISKRGQQQLIDSIEVHDERFKTQEGISINSTVGDIKQTAAGMGSVKQIGEVLYLVTQDKRTMFELEVGADTLPAEWLKSGDVSSLPDAMKIRSIILM
ncbi:MAG: ankyrin repeat domain-containing protein, partial [Pelosinus sp.]|nr:ankyrin repeat domain-containing protein [Pelosinus sp.]